jgi:hypothetical protein
MTKTEFIAALQAQMPAFLRIDTEASEAALLTIIATAATEYIESGAGTYVPWASAGRVMMLALCVAADMYDQRIYASTAVQNSTRRLMDDFFLQLRLEASAAEAEALAAAEATT